ncbi:transcriptional repressor [Mesonia sp.]|uniref:Fur family transcriptional regulator n=1 Tax=Mesonia sp. TaxID=1960830 RepID=UPI0017775CD2|nr:transcriptional repressor [Mesonia sp.]HIB38270.1 transcriptional repressor [Mesonia sp.]HIO25975.1 transcriptional repressor [Flavobacteriaceae bacterium]
MKRRNTQFKSEIFDLLQQSNHALNHEMITEALNLKIDRTTIYRILNSFCEDGKVHKIIGDDGKQYFAYCENCKKIKNKHSHKHLHFRCLSCGKLECLKQRIDVDLPMGYDGKMYNFLISGYCNTCNAVTE